MFCLNFFRTNKGRLRLLFSASEILKTVRLTDRPVCGEEVSLRPGLAQCGGVVALWECLVTCWGLEQWFDLLAVPATNEDAMIGQRLGHLSIKTSHTQRAISPLLPLWSPDRSHPYVSISPKSLPRKTLEISKWTGSRWPMWWHLTSKDPVVLSLVWPLTTSRCGWSSVTGTGTSTIPPGTVTVSLLNLS